MGKFTKKDAEKMGMPLQLLNKWKMVMDTLWGFLSAFSKNQKAVKIKAIENKILYQLANGHPFIIEVNFVNQKYLSLRISIENNEDFEVTISHIDQFLRKGIIKTIANILTYSEKIK